MTMNVVNPARTSVRRSVPRSASLKCRSIGAIQGLAGRGGAARRTSWLTLHLRVGRAAHPRAWGNEQDGGHKMAACGLVVARGGARRALTGCIAAGTLGAVVLDGEL